MGYEAWCSFNSHQCGARNRSNDGEDFNRSQTIRPAREGGIGDRDLMWSRSEIRARWRKVYLHNAELILPKDRMAETGIPMEARSSVGYDSIWGSPLTTLHRFSAVYFSNHNDYGYGIFLLDKEVGNIFSEIW